MTKVHKPKFFKGSLAQLNRDFVARHPVLVGCELRFYGHGATEPVNRKNHVESLAPSDTCTLDETKRVSDVLEQVDYAICVANDVSPFKAIEVWGPNLAGRRKKLTKLALNLPLRNIAQRLQDEARFQEKKPSPARAAITARACKLVGDLVATAQGANVRNWRSLVRVALLRELDEQCA